MVFFASKMDVFWRPAKAWQSWRVFGRNIPWMPGPQEVGEDGSDSPEICAFFFFWKPAGPAAGHLDDLMIFLEPQQKLTKQKVALQRKLHVHFGQPLDESLHLIQDKAFDYICATGFERQSEVGGNAFVIHLTEWTCDMRRDWKSSCRYFKTLIPGTTWPRPRFSSLAKHGSISEFLLRLRRRTIRVSQGLDQPH